MDPDPVQVGLELYARGYFNTRKEAIGLARAYPDKAQALLAPHRLGEEMGHAEDRAVGDDW